MPAVAVGAAVAGNHIQIGPSIAKTRTQSPGVACTAIIYTKIKPIAVMTGVCGVTVRVY